ncbi:uncharacterized protein LOC126679777 [Mercurialis annua]|uniref:uncharacterized protein LOC126679777 n=1 Tax=Mercurialis annua TaxID=3986 RepID=UPI00215E1AC5|nr:uncharacterized protein LOC126679777 [Mercurialis annua]
MQMENQRLILTNATSSPTRRSYLDYIEHPVSKLDTLAGVAIKYGVEVADIRKMNGLVSDLQMFALKSLQIPLPGRHPPSSSLSNGHHNSPRQQASNGHSGLFDSFQSLKLNSSKREVSQAMSSLRGYYGLEPITDPESSIALEMADCLKGDFDNEEDVQYLRPLPATNRPLSVNRKSKSLLNGFLDENNGLADSQLSTETSEIDSEKWNEKLLRRRQKSETDFTSMCPETLMREDSYGGASSAIKGKSLAPRSKAASRTVTTIDTEISTYTDLPTNGGFSSVRKSSSTSSLQDQDSASIWPTSKWNLKPDLQALSAAATRPIFDGLPKPATNRRNKAA